MHMVKVRDTYFPIVLHTFAGDVMGSEMDAHMTTLDGLLARKIPWVSIIVARRLSILEKDSLVRHARWFNANRERCHQYWLGTGFVFTSPVSRLVFAAFVATVNLPFPYQTSSELEVGRNYVCSLLVKANLGLPGKLPSEEDF